jgi:hypothetical protein
MSDVFFVYIYMRTYEFWLRKMFQKKKKEGSFGHKEEKKRKENIKKKRN